MTIEPNFHLLLIDDNRAIHDDFRKVLCSGGGGAALEEAERRLFGECTVAEEIPGFVIDSAYQGAAGVELLRTARAAGRPYAMAFVDVRMPPGMDGIETVERLWALDPDLQVVICSAYSDYSWPEMIGRLGRSDRLLVLKKPFDSTEVLQIACALTEKWRLVQQARWNLEAVTGLVEARTAELRQANQQLHAEIAHRELVEAQLRQAQRLESIGTLAGGIAHNLNNMLCPILMGAPALLTDMPRAGREQLVHTIETSAQRAAEIVRQLLTFARGAGGERTPLLAGAVLGEVRKIVAETFPSTIAIETTVARDLALIEADATQVQQLLINLCVNARDAMPEGGTLALEAANFEVVENCAAVVPEARVGHYIVLRVTDTGRGIPRDVLDKIFDPFFTTKPANEGSGLGLSAVAGIVRGHGGFLNVSSRVGKGSVFEVFLPVMPACAAVVAAPCPTEMPAGHGELVLVVDDESGLRDVLTAILAEHGYQTLSAADGSEALLLYTAHRAEIKAVLTDVVMPVLDGAGLCRALRLANPSVKIVVSTGEAKGSQFAQLRLLGVKSILAKPYSTSHLLVTLREALGSSAVDLPAGAGSELGPRT